MGPHADAPLVDDTGADEDVLGIYDAEDSEAKTATAQGITNGGAALNEAFEEDEASELSSHTATAGAAAGARAAAVVHRTNLLAGYNFNSMDVKIATKKLLVRRLRQLVQRTQRRSDGRGVEEVRPIEVETSLLPGAHGSALFTRGETQAICTATLGSKAMQAR